MATSLTIVGLGPGNPSLRTIAAQRALENATSIVLRTSVHPGLSDLISDPRVTACDDLYESCNRFDEVYRAIVDRVTTIARARDVVYAVPGHPFCGESTVGSIIERLAGSDVVVTVVDGISAIDSIATELNQDLLLAEVQILDAVGLAAATEAEPYAGGLIDIALTRPCLILQVYSRSVASNVKLGLMRILPADHELAVVTASGGVRPGEVVWCPLHELDHQPISHLTTVWVPALDSRNAFRSTAMLQRVIAQLRAPGGCPWDRAQSHASLRSAIVEEAYEVLDAIDAGDSEALAEELGDLLFQPLMHAQIAEESGAFAFEDVVEHATRKLVRRHPHVFGEAHASTPSDVMATWESVKAEERREKGQSAPDVKGNPFDRLPRSMPAATRVAHTVVDKQHAPEQADPAVRDRLGEALFEAVAALAKAGFDPELEIERAAHRRFQFIDGPQHVSPVDPTAERS
ncbi:MAG: MazG family protein [Thermomicrobiales bacterium]